MSATQTERQSNRRPTRTKRVNVATGVKLRRQRLRAGLSPEDLGADIGVSGRTIRRIEDTGMVPTARTMFAIAKWAGEDVVQLWRL